MFINDVHKKDEIRTIAIQDLKKFGVKFRPKKTRHVQETKSRKVFKTPLHQLPMEVVTLPSGQQLVVPKIVNDLCSFIITKIDTEGLFRKGGSKSRQNEIRLSLDAGCYLGEDHHEIDVASVLKTFFRELPEPLIPFAFHELFLRCMLLSEHQIDTVLLSCLLLPTEHLNTLTYFMQFLHRVSEYTSFNKMDAYNLAVVMGPTLLPAEEKLPPNPTQRLTKTCELFKLLIENSSEIGVLSENIIERIAISGSQDSLHDADDAVSLKKKKKRRSGSLTRMLSGLKKIVSAKTEEYSYPATPDLLLTPCLTRSAKKRKIESAGISNKKRRQIVNNLPQQALLNTPFTPARTPVAAHPDATSKKSPEKSAKEKRTLWSSKPKPKKNPEDPNPSTNPIQRRWSAVSSAAAGLRKKKPRTSLNNKIPEKDPIIDNRINDLSEELTKNLTDTSDSYVRISKVEYEDIKNRVIAIERRISIELEGVQTPQNGLVEVEKAYEQTLVQAEPLSPTTDQLAKRLSRELKIRKSDSHKVFRSPSARKIGSLRRRSRELNRNQSWSVSNLTPKTALKRGKPNTVFTGLPISSDGTPKKVTRSSSLADRSNCQSSDGLTVRSNSFNSQNSFHSCQKSPSVSSSSFHSCQDSSNPQSFSSPKFRSSSFKAPKTSPKTVNSPTRANSFHSQTLTWKNAPNYLNTPISDSKPQIEPFRASLAKLRSQNAGMVLAKAKLFDNLGDTDKPHHKVGKLGTGRSHDPRMCRIQTLKMENRGVAKKGNASPRKRPPIRNQKGVQYKCQNDSCDTPPSVLRDSNKMDTSDPVGVKRHVPHIKKSLNPRSPRRLGQSCRTPSSDPKTPLKVVAHNQRQQF